MLVPIPVWTSSVQSLNTVLTTTRTKKQPFDYCWQLTWKALNKARWSLRVSPAKYARALSASFCLPCEWVKIFGWKISNWTICLNLFFNALSLAKNPGGVLRPKERKTRQNCRLQSQVLPSGANCFLLTYLFPLLEQEMFYDVIRSSHHFQLLWLINVITLCDWSI